MSPASMVLAYRIYIFAVDRGWNCTLLEVAEALDVSVHRVTAVAIVKGWLRKFRASSREVGHSHRMNGRRVIDGVVMIGMDGLEALGGVYGE
ncbi:MAG TPA: hypothetical protein PKE59_00100 [Novosphingobium sp.]|jgi:hypothetical protein|nr:hypothetical protein [Novosphingobium sp.]